MTTNNESTEVRPEVIMGVSDAFHWTAIFLDTQLAGPIADEDISAFGCIVSSYVLRAFATEIALKAVFSMETGEKPHPKHDLSVLFDKLSHSAQTSLDMRFQRIRKTKDSYQGETDSLLSVLSDHKNDFEKFRYPYESADGEQVRQLVLRSVIEAVKEEFDAGTTGSRQSVSVRVAWT